MSPAIVGKYRHAAYGGSGTSPGLTIDVNLLNRLQLSLAAPRGVRVEAVPGSPVRQHGSTTVLRSEVEGGVAKTSRRLPAKEIIGSAILSAASRIATLRAERQRIHEATRNRRATCSGVVARTGF